MKLEAPMVAIFPLLVSILLLNTFSMNFATAQSTPFPVRVAVVVDMDMDSDVAKMRSSCIEMAISDFYTRQPRLVLNSKRDVVGAAAAALDLLKNVEVHAIIGPLSSMQANYMINLGVKAQLNRSQYVDFSLPYTEAGVSVVVAIKNDKSKKAWVFLKPLAWKLWLISFCSFVFMGFLIWILEHRTNEDYRGPLWHQVGKTFLFGISTKLISNLSRLMLIIWLVGVLILTQSYTASLISMLTTVQEQRPTGTDDVNELIRNRENVGYRNGSFVLGLLKSMNFDESGLLAYNFPEEMDEFFSKGSGNGGIAAAFDEISYMMEVFPKGSPLVPDISRAILNVTEGKKTTEIEKRWFRSYTICPDTTTNFSSSDGLGQESFWELFMIVGTAGALPLLIYLLYVIRFLYKNWQVLRRSDAERPSTFLQNSPGNNDPSSPISSSPEAYYVQFQDASLIRNEGEESNVIGHEIELVCPYQAP